MLLGSAPLGSTPLGSGPLPMPPPVAQDFYAGFIDLAFDMISSYGELCNYTRTDPSIAAAPTTPWFPADGAPQTQPVHVLWYTRNRMNVAALFAALNIDVPDGKLFGLIAGKELQFTPKVRDVITKGDGAEWALMSADPIQPGGRVILWYVDVS